MMCHQHVLPGSDGEVPATGEKARCVLCGSLTFRTLETAPVHLVVCKTCALVFFLDAKPAAYYEQLYKVEYGYSPPKKMAKWRNRRDREYVQWVTRRVAAQASPRLLEIGCNRGDLLVLFQNAGFEVFGIEPNVKASQYASQYLRLGNIENCSLKDAGSPANFFDAIIAVHTFEHLLDPLGSLGKIRKMLKDDGTLFLEVPDAFALCGVYRAGVAPSPYHLYVYSAVTLKRLLNQCGFEVEERL